MADLVPLQRTEKSVPYRSVIIAFTVAMAACGLARALIINATFDSTITSDPNAVTIEAGIEATIARAEANIVNPITVSIAFNEMTTGLGQSQTTQYAESYSTYRSLLANSQILSANDNTALYYLPVRSANPVDGNSTSSGMTIAAPLLRALGLNTPGRLTSAGNSGGSFDGVIGLNTSIINLSRTGAQNPGYYDLQAVAGHEIDEVLGIGGTGSTLYLNGSYTGQSAGTGAIGVLDLFRYASPGVRSWTLNPNVNAYFSIDAGATNLVYFDQNNVGADFADWGNGTPNAGAGNTPPQLQDAFGGPGADTNIGVNELTALDVVGYNLRTFFTWNPTGGTSSIVADGAGVWTNASGIWWNGTSNSAWSNAPAQNAQFGTAGTGSTTPYTVTLGSAITVETLTFANQNYTIAGVAGGLYSLTINTGIAANVNATVNAPLILGGANSWNVAAGVTLTVGGNISGGYALTVTGPGTVILSGTNSYSGATTIGGGALQFAKPTAMSASSAVTVSSGATLAVNAGGAGEFTNGTSGNGSIGGLLSGFGGQSGSVVTFASGAVLGIDTTNSGGLLTYSGNITNPGLGLAKLGTGTLILSGANAYTDGTTVNAGTLTAKGASALGAATGSLAVDNPNTGAGTATLLNLSTSAATTTGSLSGAIATPASGTNSATIQIGGKAFTVNQTTAGIYAGVIAGSGSFTLGGSSSGTLTLSGANTYTGATTISAGTLQFANPTAMSASSATSVGSGATLAVNAGGAGEFINDTVGYGTIGGLVSGLGGQGGSTVSFASGSFLGIDTTNAGGSLTYSGNITNPGLGLAKLGAGTLALSGANTYTGATTVNAGTLSLTGSLTGSNVTASGSAIFSESSTGVIAGSGTTFTQGSGGASLLAGVNTYTGATMISAGLLEFAQIAAMPAGSAVSVSSGATLAVNVGGAGQFTNGTSGNGSIGGLLSGLGGQSGSTVSFASGSILGIDTSNSGGSLTYSGNITNAGLSLAKLGAGTLVLTGSNTYSGATTVVAGTLTLGAAGALPSGTALTIGSTASTTAIFNTGGFPQTISSLTLYAVPYTNGTPVTAVEVGTGTLTVHGNISLIDSTGDGGPGFNQGAAIVAGTGGMLDLGGVVCNITVAGQVNGVTPGDLTINAIVVDGGINFTGNSSTYNGQPTGMTLEAPAPNTYAGGTTVNAGTLNIASTTTLGASTGALTLNTGAVDSTVILNSAQTVGALQTGTLGNGIATVNLNGATVALTVNQTLATTYAGVISGAGSLIKTGAAKLTLSGANTYTGGTTIQEGALVVSGSISGSVTVQSGGKLGGLGSVGNAEVQSGGKLEPGLTASGPTQGVLTAGSLLWDGGGDLLFDLSSTNHESAQLSLGTGVLTQGGSGQYVFDFLGGGKAGQTYELIFFGSTTFSSASLFSAADLAAGLTATFDLRATHLDVDIFLAPEPSAWVALVWSAGLLIGLRRFRRAARV